MEKVIATILDALRDGGTLDKVQLDRIVRARSAQAHDGRRVFAKKRILPFYLNARAENGETWRSWNVDDDLDRRFVRTLQMKPRRSASGVATITVITKPHACANNCVYCPNDPRMPKSYLSDEPACQRAERNLFHPFLQVSSRLRALEQMGHATDKVELIVLGGTWLDYPETYRIWFASELFRCLNAKPEERARALAEPDAYAAKHGEGTCAAPLHDLHVQNESGEHRVVGLVVETRPDTITAAALEQLRSIGCTKIQLGVQSVDDAILRANGRRETTALIRESFALCRLFGFKIHAHFMVNLLGATPESDREDYREFANGTGFQPDEVKLYPCALVANTQLVKHYEDGSWRPYTEKELVDLLSDNLRDTPPFMRVSRMIRDISANDILVGNKKTNLRQLVENNLEAELGDIQEIRIREIATEDVDVSNLHLHELTYDTGATTEHFLQWVTPDNKIAGFLRLSLPHCSALDRYGDELPDVLGCAMIREVHVYGFATKIDARGDSAQHHGLGRALVERACDIARASGHDRVNVISAVGTRGYYRKHGFADNGLYQTRNL